MKYADQIRQMSDEELARFLCDITIDCKMCAAHDLCWPEHNGFKYWIQEEFDDGICVT